MAFIEFNRVSVDIPVYNTNGQSLKKGLVHIATGGRLKRDIGHVIVRALDNLSFTFAEGDRIGLLGHNGAGKSTLLRVLSRAYTPTSGSITVQGQVGSLIDISLGIDSEFTGRENVYFRGRLLGMKKAFLTQKMEEIIAFSGLGNFFDLPLRTYSSGMQLRLAFAISTILRPEILLMDEWLSVGDEDFKHKAEERLYSLVAATRILVLASHSRDLIQKTCNRVLWLEHGKVRMDDTPAVVLAAYFHKK